MPCYLRLITVTSNSTFSPFLPNRPLRRYLPLPPQPAPHGMPHDESDAYGLSDRSNLPQCRSNFRLLKLKQKEQRNSILLSQHTSFCECVPVVANVTLDRQNTHSKLFCCSLQIGKLRQNFDCNFPPDDLAAVGDLGTKVGLVEICSLMKNAV